MFEREGDDPRQRQLWIEASPGPVNDFEQRARRGRYRFALSTTRGALALGGS
jgi:hypothetical protein